MTTGGFAAFVIGCIVRPDATLGLVVLGGLFVVLERVFPLRRQKVLRPGFATDCVHFVFDEVLAGLVLAAALLTVVPLLQVVVSDVVRECIGLQPRWVVVLEGLLLGEIAGYWGHRATHEIGILWRFHRLHHSIETMDWLAPNRRHPVDMAFARASVAIPLIVLGFSVPTIAAHFAIKRFQGLLVHANVRLDAGPLTWLIATPEFHHWHHADHPDAINKNYAGQLPLVDWLFGSLHLPRPTWPERYGCGVQAPSGYLAQLIWPFQRSQRGRVKAAVCPGESSQPASAPRPENVTSALGVDDAAWGEGGSSHSHEAIGGLKLPDDG